MGRQRVRGRGVMEVIRGVAREFGDEGWEVT